MHSKYNIIISSLFALLATWTVFGAIPYLRLNSPYPQVDTQIIFFHFLCGIMFFYFAVQVFIDRNAITILKHPLIVLSFLLAIISLISSLFSTGVKNSFAGSPQVGQGAFWYFDLTIMSIIFAQVTYLKKIRLIIFINLLFLTGIVSLFTFYPGWQGIRISFYYFTDYLCFYGVLAFIVLTYITKNLYIHLLGFLLLGFYFSFLDNRAATLFWCTTFFAAIFYYCIQYFKKNIIAEKIKSILFSDFMFVFVIILISLLIVSCSLYFWNEKFTLPSTIKGTVLDAPVVRGKLIETSLYSLDNFKNLLIGNGWAMIGDVLLQNMNPWHYDELRQGYNLHFHTHNEIAEHLVSVGLIGALLFLIYIYFIFKYSEQFNFQTKLGWLLFFKISCFWFMWVGTFAVFAVAVSCLVFQTSGPNYEKNFFRIKLKFLYKKSVISLLAICSGSFVFYGSYLNYQSTKLHSSTQYTKILKDLENKKYTNDQECLSFYKDFNRGGYILDRFLQAYNAHIITTNPDEIHDKDLRVLEELKCKANDLIKNNNFTLSLLSSSIQADTDFYYLFGDDKDKKDQIKKTYKYWLYKANILSEKMPQRGDLLLPFLSYAVSNGKSNDALNICRKSTFGLEAFCLLLEANNILLNSNIDEISLQNSINLIKKSVNLGLFNKITYGYWIKKCMPGNRQFCDFGIRGIPLSPDLIFLISNKEKLALEKLIRNQ